ncbi:hypothetical protein BASA81_011097 [Batrachochytrium salamandrivorans]|nr:hypothetical protein BASA81_011097 [Batrachochytrium salamandrivorans]
MKTNKKSVVIAVVGDAKVGKTSLISTLVSGIFPSTVPSVLQQVLLAPEESADAEQSVLIVDTSSEESEREHLFTQILPQADVVVVVFDLAQMETFEQLPANWLNRLSSFSPALPVVLVGNKTDLSTGDSAKECKRVLERYPNVDSCFMDCSAKTNIHVSDVFYFAQHCVLFPVPALMDVKTGLLTDPFILALRRIFRFYDQDHDNLLADSELNTFQEENFGCRLQKDDLEAIKQVLQNGMGGGGGEQSTEATSFESFSFLFTLFLRRNRAETVWKVLRRFGYTNKYDLNKFVSQTLPVPKQCELTRRGLAFLANIFHQFDRDGDGVLNAHELSQVFESSQDYGGVFRESVVTNTNGDVPLSGWLAFWAMQFALDQAFGIHELERLGFPELNLLVSAIRSTEKRTGKETKINKTVLRAMCFGSGVDEFMSALVRKPSSSPFSSVCGMVRSLDPSATHSSLFLVLSKPPHVSDKPVVMQVDGEFDLCIFLFDSHLDSVDKLRAIQESIPSAIPCVYLQNAVPEEGEEGENEALQQAKALCQAYSLPEPTKIGLAPPKATGEGGGDEVLAWTAQMDKTFALFLQTALFPNCARPMSAAAQSRQKQERILRSIGRITLVCTVLGVVTWAGLRFARGRRQDD